MKKLILIITTIITVGLSAMSYATNYSGQTIFYDSAHEDQHKKLLSELEFTEAIELEYFDYFSRRTSREVAVIKYKFYEENIDLLKNFLDKSGKEVDLKNSNYLLTIQYIVGLGIVYEVKEVDRNYTGKTAES